MSMCAASDGGPAPLELGADTARPEDDPPTMLLRARMPSMAESSAARVDDAAVIGAG